MALINKLTALADVIRKLTGHTGKLTLDEMIEKGNTVESATEVKSTLNALIDRSITEIEWDGETVGSYAFYNSKLTKAVLPFATYIGQSAFGSCTKINTIYLPSVKTFYQEAFNNCGELTEVRAPLLSTVGAQAFRNCKKMTACDFPLLTEMGTNVFQGCTQLTDVNLPLITVMNQYIFSGCTSLQRISLPSLIKLTGSSLFSECTALKDVDLPLLQNVYIYTFSKCGALTKIDLPSVNRIGMRAFIDSKNLVSVILRNTDEMVTLEDVSAFDGTPIAASGTATDVAYGTGYVYFPRVFLNADDVTSDYRQATNWSVYASQFRALEDYTVDGTTTGELDPDKI